MPNDAVPEIPVSNLHNPLAAVAQSVNVAVRALNQLAQDVPDSTSDLTNDSGFITNAVTDLLNYYLKSETYTKAEVNALISAIPKLDIQVVSSLPSSGISTETIYLLTSGTESQNLYTEYIYVNGVWEKLGTQTLDLSGYATTAVMNTALSGKVDKDGAKVLSDNNYTTAEKNAVATIGNKVDKVTGKGLSTNDYTTADKNAVATIGDKVDKVAGKGLSTNDYTTADKNAVATIGDKVDKVAGKGLSTNDYTTADKNAVATIGDKVDKVAGKGLSTEDYTTAEKTKLSGIVANATANTPATAVPLMDGTAAVGTSGAYARGDHIHPTDTSRASAADVTAQGNRITALESENALMRELISRMEIYCEASGNPATFNDGAAANVKALSVTIAPSQSGSGDPSPENIRPISGVSSVTVTRTGENGTNPQTATVSFVDSNSDPLTVYGGTLDVTEGTLTVTHGNIASYNDETVPDGWISSTGQLSTGAQVVYPLATSQTYHVAPAQLATLSGYNAVTTDAGTLSVTYRADPALSLEGD